MCTDLTLIVNSFILSDLQLYLFGFSAIHSRFFIGVENLEGANYYYKVEVVIEEKEEWVPAVVLKNDFVVIIIRVIIVLSLG